jgi:hypothetical protein
MPCVAFVCPKINLKSNFYSTYSFGSSCTNSKPGRGISEDYDAPTVLGRKGINPFWWPRTVNAVLFASGPQPRTVEGA